MLTPNDVLKIVEELLPAQNQSYELGIKLNLPPHQVESIHSTYTDPGKRLLQIVIQFLDQLEPRPTWKVIVDALKCPVVNLPRLGEAIEAAHFTTPTSFNSKITRVCLSCFVSSLLVPITTMANFFYFTGSLQRRKGWLSYRSERTNSVSDRL